MNYHRNLVIVLARGLRCDAVGDAHAWPLRTTYMEQLSRRGIRLSALSACPADPGGLASLLSGLHPRQHGLVDNDPPATRLPSGWPRAMRNAGYHLTGVGCLGDMADAMHESVNVVDLDGHDASRCPYLNAVAGRGLVEGLLRQRAQRRRGGPFQPDRMPVAPEDDIDGFIGQQAQQALGAMPDDRPWALIVRFCGPDCDLPPPQLYDHLVAPSLLEEGFIPVDMRQVNALAELDHPRAMLQQLTPQSIARLRADYLGRVSLVDFGVGRLMYTLRDRPDVDRTWIVVTTDRGALIGDHGLVGHRSFLDGSLRVPAILCPPESTALSNDAWPQAVRREQPISTVDVAATIADLAGCDLPGATTGSSLLRPPPESDANPRAAPAISEFGNRIMAMSSRHKVIFDTGHGRVLAVFDRLADPDERNNLAGRRDLEPVVDRIRAGLARSLMPLRASPEPPNPAPVVDAA